MRLIYAVGVPGAGKTTLIEALLEDSGEPELETHPFAHRLYPDGSVLLGKPGVFGGTDTLSMSVQPKVLEWLAGQWKGCGTVWGEGDRLGGLGFLQAARDTSSVDLVTLVWLDLPPEVAAERRRARGTEQNESWVRGRETKVRRVVESWSALGGDLCRLDARLAPDELADDARCRLFF